MWNIEAAGIHEREREREREREKERERERERDDINKTCDSSCTMDLTDLTDFHFHTF